MKPIELVYAFGVSDSIKTKLALGSMRISFIIPGQLDTPTGGYHYDRSIINCWREAGHEVEVVTLPDSFPCPTDKDIEATFNILKAHSFADVAVVDGLAGGALEEIPEYISKQCPLVSLVHHPLFLETGIEEETALHLKEQERLGFNHTRHVITTSPFTRQQVSEIFNIPIKQISTVLPGVERGPIANPDNKGEVNLLCVASITERKGHQILLEALSDLKNLKWKLDCYGMTDADPGLYDKLTKQVTHSGLTEWVTFHGSVDHEQLEQAYKIANIFVLPSLYEGYGMVFAEAVVRGIPVIGTIAGAIPDTIPKGCGILVEPGNVPALQNAIASLITDETKRSEMRKMALKNEPDFPTWKGSADKFIQILEAVS